MNKTDKIYIAGHTGLVGSAFIRILKDAGYTNLVYRTHSELDLTNQADVKQFFDVESPDIVLLCAAKVGGILSNSLYKADYITENILIETNIINESFKHNVKKLLFLGSTCIYPKNIMEELKETDLLNGPLEYTNECYSLAKITGIKMCEAYNLQYGTNYIIVMPTNLYGINDNFDLVNGHFLPMLIRKIHLAKLLADNNFEEIKKDLEKRPIGNKTLVDLGIEKNKLTLWGTGVPYREYMLSDDMAKACLHILETIDFKDIIKIENYSNNGTCKHDIGEIKNTHINISTDEEYSIKEISKIVADIIGYNGTISFDDTKPDGVFRKHCNIDKLNEFGFNSFTKLATGIKEVYNWYINS